MNGSAADAGLRERRLRALGVEPWRLRARGLTPAPVPAARAAAVPVDAVPAAPAAIRRLALQPDLVELRDPALNRMYVALTEAVAKAGLQAVRVCDVANDPTAAVMVFGAAPPPAGVPAARTLAADSLALLHADRERKRLLWERMLALGGAGRD